MTKIVQKLLLPFSYCYILGSKCYQKLHDWNILPQKEFDLPVLNIGNLAMGGTGKTPHVIWIAEYLTSIHLPIGIVSRGYNRKSTEVLFVQSTSNANIVGDEPLLFRQKLPTTTIVVAHKRSQGIEKIRHQFPQTKVILLDDGLQHWGIIASTPILLTTFAQPFFEDAVVPAGYLRAPQSDYKKAKAIIITKCPQNMTIAQKQYFEQKINLLPHQQLFFSSYHYLDCYEWQTPTVRIPWHKMTIQPLLVVTAIANTQYLEDYLASENAITSYQRFSDHHYFSQQDIDAIALQATGKIILTTEKDATRLQLHQDYIQSLGLKVYCLPLEVHFLFEAEDTFKQFLREEIKI
jgi:tetraacyldisaccharide 4'-kinase